MSVEASGTRYGSGPVLQVQVSDVAVPEAERAAEGSSGTSREQQHWHSPGGQQQPAAMAFASDTGMRLAAMANMAPNIIIYRKRFIIILTSAVFLFTLTIYTLGGYICQDNLWRNV
jgi:hypothetical protein